MRAGVPVHGEVENWVFDAYTVSWKSGQSSVPYFVSLCAVCEGKNGRGEGSDVMFVRGQKERLRGNKDGSSPFLLSCIGLLFLAISKPINLNSFSLKYRSERPIRNPLELPIYTYINFNFELLTLKILISRLLICNFAILNFSNL